MADAGNQLHVRLVTPDKVLIDQEADAVELPSKSGYMEVLYGHAPLLAELGVGEVRLHGGGNGDQTYFVVWGFVEVLPDRVTILAQAAIKPEEIDAGEAQRELESGQKMWNEAGEDAEKYAQANEVIHEAQAKLASAHAG
ncbi:MAG TPA: ATP synthase F1 subunit epsilon [Acidobacteriaceae bacterium]|jgi:F-type H+-transporting ATPase subunit epsilon|nr:ATP synthase F1 subunit epsilon [Acidobacteriaceae bacterium]